MEIIEDINITDNSWRNQQRKCLFCKINRVDKSRVKLIKRQRKDKFSASL